MGCLWGTITICVILPILFKYPLTKIDGPVADYLRSDDFVRHLQIIQLTAVYTELMIIVGLCLDGGKSVTSRFFNTKVMQFLGRFSMSLYLIHVPTMEWIKLCIYGPFFVPLPAYAMLPTWSIPIEVILSLSLAIPLTIFIEEPANRKLKNFKNPKTSWMLGLTGLVMLTLGILAGAIGAAVFKGRIVM